MTLAPMAATATAAPMDRARVRLRMIAPPSRRLYCLCCRCASTREGTVAIEAGQSAFAVCPGRAARGRESYTPVKGRAALQRGTLADVVDWYTQVEVGSDVIRISEPHVNDLLSANFWWLRGSDRDILIDAG